MKRTGGVYLAGKKKRGINWHSGFFNALQLELREFLDRLQLHQEVQLNTEPLRIDALVIQNLLDTPIDKNIARIFRRYNIFEYKSRDDSFSVKDFYKALCYTYLYQVIHKEASIMDMTLTVVTTNHPRDLIKYLKKTQKYSIKEKCPGISYVDGADIPVQIIECKKLAAGENLWLNNLTDKLKKENFEKILTDSYSIDMDTSAYLSVLSEANPNIIKELDPMGRAALRKNLVELGWADEWKSEGRTEGEKIGVAKGEKIGVAKGEKIRGEKEKLRVKESLLSLLRKKFGAISQSVEDQVDSFTIDQLHRVTKSIFEIQSLDEIEKYAGI